MQRLENNENISIKIGDDTIKCVKDLNIIAEKIKEYYILKSEVCIGELLNNIRIHELTIEESAILYAKVYKLTDDDEVVRHSDGYDIDLWRDEQ